MADSRDVPEGAQFGLANIPFGVVSTVSDPSPKAATRLHDRVFLLPGLIERGLLSGVDEAIQKSLQTPTLNEFASLGRAAHRQVREALQCLLRDLDQATPDLTSCVLNVADVRYHLPVTVGDFSDFSCSKDHVLNAGEAVQGVRQLPPGFLHFPVGYGGRSSSILPPESNVYRPNGQFRSPEGVKFGHSRAMDFELEVACVIGKPSNFGEPVDIDSALDHIFGFLLLNDWSARDIQGLEMNPLGPFNGKSLGTSISPWIITADALEPFRAASVAKEETVAPYLQSSSKKSHYAIQLNAEIEADGVRTTVCQSRFEWLYWNVDDMIAHQTINGCPLNAGDILATGTVSGSERGSHGCLLEATKGGKQPFKLKNGEERTYLMDNDAVRLTGWAGNPGSSEMVGFGQCFGRLLPGKEFKKALLKNGH